MLSKYLPNKEKKQLKIRDRQAAGHPWKLSGAGDLVI